jgi:hypothetical protein
LVVDEPRISHTTSVLAGPRVVILAVSSTDEFILTPPVWSLCSTSESGVTAMFSICGDSVVVSMPKAAFLCELEYIEK